jgi:valyl-tRNA synthetase
MDRFEARKAVAQRLEELGVLIKKESHIHKVGTSERTKAVIEPRLSDQWFLRMEDLVKPAIDAVLKDEEVKLFPSKFNNTYRNWVENIRDWNISRQLWWGQQIPAYYYGDGQDDFVVAQTAEKALELARAKSSNNDLKASDLRQDADVLDTWFSSWLWPMSVFNGILEPDNKEFNYYYPTNDLVTGPDILFFWVIRMIIAGYEFKGEKPFSNVYLTGLVRDSQRRKMSKSLGNSPDALKLIEDYGADGVRVGLLLSSAAGNDLMFDESLCNQGKNFANKIWNGFRLVQSWEVDDQIPQPEAAALAIEWYKAKFNQTLEQIEDHYSKYRISDALMATYKLIWDDYSSWLLELVKPAYQQPIDKKTYDAIVELLEGNLKLLHPFMPFLTEEVWQYIKERQEDGALIVAQWPEGGDYDQDLIASFEIATEIISGIRTIRKEKNIPNKDTLELFVMEADAGYDARWDSVLEKMGNLSSLQKTVAPIDAALSFRVKSTEFFIPIGDAIDVEAELEKIEKELSYTEGFLNSVRKKLSNERFVSNAPEQVIAIERQKEADALAKIETLKLSRSNLKK